MAVYSEEKLIMKLKNTDEKINKKPLYKKLLGLGTSVILGAVALSGCATNTTVKPVPGQEQGVEANNDENEQYDEWADPQYDTGSESFPKTIDDNETAANTEPTEEQESPEFSAEIDPANFEIVPEWSVEEKMELAERLIQAFRRDGSKVIVYYIGDQKTVYDTKGNVFRAADPYLCYISYSKDRDGDGEVDHHGGNSLTYSDIDINYRPLETN